MNIEQFREKYGTLSARLEEDLNFIIQCDMEDFKTDLETKQCGYKTIMNSELSSQFVDYIKAIGKYDEMFFLTIPSGTMFYAYEEYGKHNIIKKLSDIADDYKTKAKELEAAIKEAVI